MKTFSKDNSQNGDKGYKGKKGVKSYNANGFKGKNGKSGGADGIKFIQNKNKKIAIDDNRKNLRRLYNRLMQKDQKKKNTTNKADLVKKVMQMIDNNFTEYCFKPDGCRVLQGCIKYGDKNQRREIIKSLKSQFYEMIIKKYAIYLAIKMFKYSDNKHKEELISESIIPNFSKLIKNANGQLFLNYVFDNSLIKQQNLICDHYIKKVLKVNLDDLLNLQSATDEQENKAKNPSDPSNDIIILEKQGTYQQDNLKDLIKSHVEKQLEKGIHKVFCFQAFLNRVFDMLDQKTKCYISEVFDDDINEILTNKTGIELACKLFTVASVKTRKKMIKKIKENVKSYLSNESIIIFLIKIILFTDDTKLVEKHILNTLVEVFLEEFLTNKSILKIFCNLLNYKNNKINTQQENKILSYDIFSSSKKDNDKRQEEILSSCINQVFEIIHLNIKFCLTDQYYVIILNDLVDYLIKINNKEKLGQILNDIVNVLEIDYKKNFDELSNIILAEKTGHFAINKIIKSFENLNNLNNQDVAIEFEKLNHEFCSKISKILFNNVEGFLNTKAIFIFVNILENDKTRYLVEKELLKHKALIKQKQIEDGLIGFQILAKNLFK